MSKPLAKVGVFPPFSSLPLIAELAELVERAELTLAVPFHGSLAPKACPSRPRLELYLTLIVVDVVLLYYCYSTVIPSYCKSCNTPPPLFPAYRYLPIRLHTGV